MPKLRPFDVDFEQLEQLERRSVNGLGQSFGRERREANATTDNDVLEVKRDTKLKD